MSTTARLNIFVVVDVVATIALADVVAFVAEFVTGSVVVAAIYCL